MHTHMLVHNVGSFSSTLCQCATNNRSKEKKRERKKTHNPPSLAGGVCLIYSINNRNLAEPPSEITY